MTPGREIDALDDAAQCGNEPLTGRADDAIHLVAPGAEDLDELAERLAVGRFDAQPDEVVPVVRAGLELAARHLQVTTGERLGRFPAVDPCEVDHRHPAPHLDVVDPAGRGLTLGPDLGVGLQAFGPVGQDLDAKPALQPLGAENARDGAAITRRRRRSRARRGDRPGRPSPEGGCAERWRCGHLGR